MRKVSTRRELPDPRPQKYFAPSTRNLGQSMTVLASGMKILLETKCPAALHPGTIPYSSTPYQYRVTPSSREVYRCSPISPTPVAIREKNQREKRKRGKSIDHPDLCDSGRHSHFYPATGLSRSRSRAVEPER
jgi:hypothetical protein